jgi:hypothetical protein
MLPSQFYFSAPGWVGYLIYVPIAIVGVSAIYRLLLRRISNNATRIVSLSAISIVLLTWPLWEAMAISIQGEKLCLSQGGLHIYRTAETDGFLGGWGIETASKHGFEYAEVVGLGGKFYRQHMKNGVKIEEEINEFTSRYQVQIGADSEDIDRQFRRSTSRVVIRDTGEVLGEFVTITIYPSRFDNIFLGLVGAGSKLWLCGRESHLNNNKKLGYDDLILATLVPSGEGEEERK